MAETARASIRPQSKLAIVATVFDRELDRYFYEFEFVTVEQRIKRLLVGRELSVRPDQILSTLLSAGADLPVRKDIALGLIVNSPAAIPRRKYELTRKCGWDGNEFVFFDQTFGPNPKRIRLESAELHAAHGTLDGWKRGLKSACKDSSYLTFAISAGFAAPLMSLIGVNESCGFHFHGARARFEGRRDGSSSGKTTATRAMTSVFEKADVRTLLTHDVSPRGLVERCAKRNDLALGIDEMGRIEGPARAAAMARLAYTVASGKGREISEQVAREKGLPNLTWRVILLSSGETPLDDPSEGLRRAEGEQVRLISIAVPSGEVGGIFDRLKGEAQERLSRATILTQEIDQTIAENYGVAARSYLKCLADKPDAVRTLARKEVKSFLRKADVSHPWDRRFAEKFALISAGAMLAARYGVAPWTAKQARNRVWRVYQRAREALERKPIEPARDLIPKLAEASADAHRFPVVAKGSRFPTELQEFAWGIRRRISGRDVLVVRHDNQAPAICRELEHAARTHPAWRDILSRGKDGRHRQVEIKGLTDKRERFVCIELERLSQLHPTAEDE